MDADDLRMVAPVSYASSRPEAAADAQGKFMTVENFEVIDGLGISKESGEVVLTISDHLPWDTASEHFEKLEGKIGRYLDFIRSGQLLESVPDAAKRQVRISVFCKHQPDDNTHNFLLAAGRQLAHDGVKLSFVELPDVY